MALVSAEVLVSALVAVAVESVFGGLVCVIEVDGAVCGLGGCDDVAVKVRQRQVDGSRLVLGGAEAGEACEVSGPVGSCGVVGGPGGAVGVAGVVVGAGLAILAVGPRPVPAVGVEGEGAGGACLGEGVGEVVYVVADGDLCGSSRWGGECEVVGGPPRGSGAPRSLRLFEGCDDEETPDDERRYWSG